MDLTRPETDPVRDGEPRTALGKGIRFRDAIAEHARRRGLGTALTALKLHAAKRRGCATASLQATPMAERMYTAIGFRDLGRILEFAPR
jgi:GNAT superfamily N-acetyltransferase